MNKINAERDYSSTSMDVVAGRGRELIPKSSGSIPRRFTTNPCLPSSSSKSPKLVPTPFKLSKVTPDPPRSLLGTITGFISGRSPNPKAEEDDSMPSKSKGKSRSVEGMEMDETEKNEVEGAVKAGEVEGAVKAGEVEGGSHGEDGEARDAEEGEEDEFEVDAILDHRQEFVSIPCPGLRGSS